MSTFKTVLVSVGLAVAVSVIAAVGFVSSIYQKAPGDSQVGYQQGNPGEFPEGALIGQLGVRGFAFSIPAGQNQTSYRNTSGRRQYVDLLVMRTTGTASSTVTLTAGTSTSSTFNSFLVQSSHKSLLNVALSTSTTATSTNSVQGLGAPTGAPGAGVAKLEDGEYLNIGFYETYGYPCNGATCESATSSARGYNVDGIFRVLQIP